MRIVKANDVTEYLKEKCEICFYKARTRYIPFFDDVKKVSLFLFSLRKTKKCKNNKYISQRLSQNGKRMRSQIAEKREGEKKQKKRRDEEL